MLPGYPRGLAPLSDFPDSLFVQQINSSDKSRRQFLPNRFNSRHANSPHRLSPSDPPDEDLPMLKQLNEGIEQRRLFTEDQCSRIEQKINEVVETAELDEYKPCTVDRAPLRNK